MDFPIPPPDVKSWGAGSHSRSFVKAPSTVLTQGTCSTNSDRIRPNDAHVQGAHLGLPALWERISRQSSQARPRDRLPLVPPPPQHRQAKPQGLPTSKLHFPHPRIQAISLDKADVSHQSGRFLFSFSTSTSCYQSLLQPAFGSCLPTPTPTRSTTGPALDQFLGCRYKGGFA